MSDYFKMECPSCGGSVEFPSDAVGRDAPCPHCSQNLILYSPVVQPPIISPSAPPGMPVADRPSIIQRFRNLSPFKWHSTIVFHDDPSIPQRIRNPSPLPILLLIVGVPISVVGGFALLAGVATLFDVASLPESRASESSLGAAILGCIFILFLFSVGLLLCLYGLRTWKILICPKCGNRIDSTHVRMCPTCKCGL